MCVIVHKKFVMGKIFNTHGILGYLPVLAVLLELLQI